MSRASVRSQCVAELERACERLPVGVDRRRACGRRIRTADDPGGVGARADRGTRAQWRCAVDLRFDANAIERYASLDAADRLRVRTRLCDLARRAVDERKPHVEDAAIECNAALDVTRAGLDAALRAP